MDLTYENGLGIISVNSMMPSNDHFANKNFTISGTNSTTQDMNYNLNLIIKEYNNQLQFN